MTLQAVQPRAEIDGDGDQVAEAARERALALVHAGLPLGVRELALILRKGVSQVHREAKRGVYDDFRLRPALGPKRYSGVLIGRWLRGDVLNPPTFGRKRG